MQNNSSKSKAFVLLANRRTGSNYLMKVLDSFPDMEFFGEVYHKETVWMPVTRKKDYVNWLAANRNTTVKIGEKSFEDKELVRLNHEHPEYFLDFLVSTTQYKYAGFKIFPEHLGLNKLKERMLVNSNITKIVLRRNLLDVYISDKILQQTKHSQAYDTSNIKVYINCAEFKHWYFTTRSYFSHIELCLKNNNQEYLELLYEDIHSYDNDREKVEYVHSWFVDNGFDLSDFSALSEYTKKQDKRKNTLAKVENDEELEQYLKKNDLHFLIHYQ